MAEYQYTDALKQGLKEYRTAVVRGEYPYLPVLDQIIPEHHPGSERDLGVVQIPAEFIVGTKTAARANLFSRGFLPLAPEKSEFASKWEALCQAQLEEGIRDPIEVVEYLKKFSKQEFKYSRIKFVYHKSC